MGEMAGRWNSLNTYNVNQLISPSYMGTICGTPKTMTIVTSKITDHR